MGFAIRTLGAVAAAGIAAGWAPSAVAGDSWSYYDGYNASYAIPYVADLDFAYGANPPRAMVEVSVNGGETAHFQLDTGSQGMVVPYTLVPDFQPTGKPGSITYVSSGIKAVGYWTDVDVHFPGSTDGQGNIGVATAKIQVLVATETCNTNTNDCDLPLGDIPRMIGIGFDRTGEGTVGMQPSLLNNPFLHITDMDAGTMRSGYIFTSDHVEVGLTAANAGSGFAMYKLLPNTIPNQAGQQWTTLPGTFVITRDGSTTTRSDLPLLLDTGIGYAWVDIGGPTSHEDCPADDPTLPSFASCAAPGAEVTVYFGGSDQVGFTYTTGDTLNPVAPWFTRTDNNLTQSNIGIHPIAGFDYLFDAAGGFEGLRATGVASSHVVFTLFISMAGTWSLSEAMTTDLPVYVRAAAEIEAAQRTTFESDVTGPAALTVSGAGEVVFLGDVTLPAGLTVAGRTSLAARTTAPVAVQVGGQATNTGTIAGDVANAGTFVNDGVVDGDVGNRGRLTGNGHITGDLVSTGSVSPGHSIGEVSVAGDAAFASGSVYHVEIGADGEADRIEIGGALTVEDARLDVILLPGESPWLGARYEVVTASAVSGDFDVRARGFARLSSPYPFLDVTAESDSAAVILKIARSEVSFAAAGRTENQVAVGGSLDSLAMDSGVVDSIVVLDAMSARAAYDQLSGAIYPSVRGMFVDQATGVRDTVLARLHQSYAAPGSGGAIAPQTAALATGSPSAMWVTSYGDWGGADASENVASFTRTFAGVIGGVDTALPTVDWRAGIAGGYAHTSFAIDDYGSSGSSRGVDFAAYAGGPLVSLGRGTARANLGAGFGVHDVLVDRHVAYPGLAESLSSDFEATTTQLFGELAYAYEMGPTPVGRVTMEPFAGLGYVSARTDAFREHGGDAALDGGSGSFGAAMSQLGLRGEARLPFSGVAADVSGMIGWQHIFGDTTPTADLAFAAGSSTFTVAGAPVAEDALIIGAGIDAAVAARARIGVSYLGQVAFGADNHAVNGTLSVRF
ncbi:MAG: autotransporter domain-containing protein [Bauldia sp.]|nr:autotransporter domain-containing protein [Bauldia sp.]